ncbi:hypothetical protein [Konateibacter massiliensis]|uniref:hypothetical protein n=1 Tax=Konateibacter massiliensis TaxID=2002841 RepID=UPI000C1477E2|nr:hypothetical protein [Konateibacter massiliensis]
MRYEKKLILMIAVMGVFFLTGGCKESAQTTAVKESTAQVISEQPQTQEVQPEAVQVSTEVSELYQSQTLMLEMLVNETCVIEDTGDMLTIATPDGMAYISVGFVPGIQNLGATASLLPALLQESYNATVGEVSDGSLFGARAKRCNYSVAQEDGSQVEGVFAAAVVNQSLYMMDAAFLTGCTDEDAELIINIFSSMNVLMPTSVNTETKTATYESKYPNAAPSKAAQTTYVPVTEWVYLPYYYYGWDLDYDYTIYDASFYEPDWNYYSDGNWWSWAWDDNGDWGFYDEYGDWYSEDYYSYYADYYDGYDPYSDPGDYYDYYYDDYDYYSDPGDTYDDYDYYSDPGDTYDDYDYYSDPGDTYDYDDSYIDYDYGDY